MRKLAFELPLDVGGPGEEMPAARREVFEVLSRALESRKRATIEYYSIGKDETSERTVEPYGLFFTGSNWYLAARDTAHGEVRTYRVRRISSASINGSKKQTADYQIPRAFDLRAYSERQPWQLGEDEEREVVVEFTGESGAAAAAARLGAVISGQPARRKFTVRRPDMFARWLLSFAGEAHVSSPKGIQATVRDEAARTLALYNSRGGDG
jgi:predicted DNA-binding transcriptional regulator YafY